ncbi:unnamed protein product [Prunus armeniaca]|uniref:DNA-directed DNA polymerase n=1 Tax=Prunus armeniaca TaxID=36596 RepID=A0A6J5UYW9_PRUAR|nr:unnamed protein product [Prunus armeniaca]
MPGGVPVWHGNLEGKDLDSMFGFIEAYVVRGKGYQVMMAMSYVYKILMNSLYGRFGINPKSTTTEQYREGLRLWNPPKNSAVQLAAAITASARIYMYPYISREDCYYTDTDSVVLGQPLPKEVISSSVLGKFKLEDRVMKGYFLAPKSYCYIAIGGSNILKYKGPAKNQVNQEWFESQYADPSRTKQVPVEANFRIDWHTLNIIKKDTMVRVGLQLGDQEDTSISQRCLGGY